MSTEEINRNINALKKWWADRWDILLLTTMMESQLQRSMIEPWNGIIWEVEKYINEETYKWEEIITTKEMNRLFGYMNKSYQILFSDTNYKNLFNIFSHLRYVEKKRPFTKQEKIFIENTQDFIEVYSLTADELDSSICIKILKKLAVLSWHDFESIFYHSWSMDTWRIQATMENTWIDWEKFIPSAFYSHIEFSDNQKKLINEWNNVALLLSFDHKQKKQYKQNRDSEWLYTNGEEEELWTKLTLEKNDEYAASLIPELYKKLSTSSSTAKTYVGIFNKHSKFNVRLARLRTKFEFEYNPLQYAVSWVQWIQKYIKTLLQDLPPSEDKLRNEYSDWLQKITIILSQLQHITSQIKNQRTLWIHLLDFSQDILFREKANIKTLLEKAQNIAIHINPKIPELSPNNIIRLEYDDISQAVKLNKWYIAWQNIINPYTHIAENLQPYRLTHSVNQSDMDHKMTLIIYNMITRENLQRPKISQIVSNANIFSNIAKMFTKYYSSFGKLSAVNQKLHIQKHLNSWRISITRRGSKDSVVLSNHMHINKWDTIHVIEPWLKMLPFYKTSNLIEEYIKTWRVKVTRAWSKKVERISVGSDINIWDVISIDDYLVEDYISWNIRSSTLANVIFSKNFSPKSIFRHSDEIDLSPYGYHTEKYKKTLSHFWIDVRTYKIILQAFDELKIDLPEENIAAWLAIASSESSLDWDPKLEVIKRKDIAKKISLLTDITDWVDDEIVSANYLGSYVKQLPDDIQEIWAEVVENIQEFWAEVVENIQEFWAEVIESVEDLVRKSPNESTINSSDESWSQGSTIRQPLKEKTDVSDDFQKLDTHKDKEEKTFFETFKELVETKDWPDIMTWLTSDEEKKELNKIIEAYKELTIKANNPREFQVYELNRELADFFVRHLEKVKTLASKPKWYLPPALQTLWYILYEKEINKKILKLRSLPNSFWLWQKNVDFLIEDIQNMPWKEWWMIIDDYPELINAKKDPDVDLRDFLVRSLSWVQWGLSKWKTIKLLIQSDFLPCFNNHNLKNKDWTVISENIDYLIVENYTWKMSPFFAAFQYQLNTQFGGSLKIDWDLVYKWSNSRSINWEKTHEESNSYRLIFEKFESWEILIPWNTSKNRQTFDEYLWKMVLHKTYEELKKDPLYNSIMWNVPIRWRRMIPTHWGREFVNDKKEKWILTPQMYIDKVKNRATPKHQESPIINRTNEQNKPSEKLIETLKWLWTSEFRRTVLLIKKYTLIEIKKEADVITIHWWFNIRNSIVKLQEKLKLESIDGLYGKITHAALMSYPQLEWYSWNWGKINTTAFWKSPIREWLWEDVEIIIAPNNKFAVWYYPTLKDVKEKIQSLNSPAYMSHNWEKIPVWFSYWDHNGIKKVPTQQAAKKSYFAIHASETDDNTAISAWAQDWLASLTVTKNANTILNYPTILWQWALWVDPQLEKAGFDTQINRISIAQEISLKPSWKMTLWSNHESVQITKNPSQNQRITTYNNYQILKSLHWDELFLIDSRDAIFDQDWWVIKWAHWDWFSNNHMIEMWWRKRFERQKRINMHRQIKLTQRWRIYFKTNTD